MLGECGRHEYDSTLPTSHDLVLILVYLLYHYQVMKDILVANVFKYVPKLNVFLASVCPGKVVLPLTTLVCPCAFQMTARTSRRASRRWRSCCRSRRTPTTASSSRSGAPCCSLTVFCISNCDLKAEDIVVGGFGLRGTNSNCRRCVCW